MNVHFSKYYLITSYMLSIFVGLSANSYFNLWFYMEINMMIFLYLIYLETPKFQWTAMLKYFVIQALSSLLFLLSATTLISTVSTNLSMVMIMSLMLKLASAPMHWWMIDLASKVSWNTLFLMSTFQKLLPLMAMSEMCNFTEKILFALINFTMGTFLIYQLVLKQFMAYSSMFNMGWMMLLMNHAMFWKLFFIYANINAAAMMMMMQLNMAWTQKSNQFTKLWKKISLSQMLNISSIPPLPGFMLKVMLVTTMMATHMKMSALLYLLASSITIFGYVKLTTRQMLSSNYFFSNSVPTMPSIFMMSLALPFSTIYLW